MSIEMTLGVHDANGAAGKQLNMRVYVLDLLGDEEAQLSPISISIEQRGGEEEVCIDLTPLDAATLRDYLDLLLRTKPWLAVLPSLRHD